MKVTRHIPVKIYEEIKIVRSMIEEMDRAFLANYGGTLEWINGVPYEISYVNGMKK